MAKAAAKTDAPAKPNPVGRSTWVWDPRTKQDDGEEGSRKYRFVVTKRGGGYKGFNDKDLAIAFYEEQGIMLVEESVKVLMKRDEE